jgi:hypothetical protein
MSHETPLPDKVADFKTLCLPIVKYLQADFNPHAQIIIDVVSAELMSGEAMILTDFETFDING